MDSLRSKSLMSFALAGVLLVAGCKTDGPVSEPSQPEPKPAPQAKAVGESSALTDDVLDEWAKEFLTERPAEKEPGGLDEEAIAELKAAERFLLGIGLVEMAGKGDLEQVKELLARKPDMNVKDKAGNTALILASAQGSAEIVRLLLGAGADPTLKNKKGASAADVARDAGHDEIVALLQKKAE